ncbi:MAG TPA: preprotein translocase subunit YajC [Gemmatimonadaceae bacterium]|nr:preprotein translocase subunit YajC [Gemmatimonadaceae bacterium]
MNLPILFALQDPAVPRGISGAGIIFQIVAIVVIIYFFLIRPQSREKKQTETMLNALKKGDEVVTVGGVIGDVVHIQMQEATVRMDDRITIKSGESRLVIERGRIVRVTAKGA